MRTILTKAALVVAAGGALLGLAAPSAMAAPQDIGWTGPYGSVLSRCQDAQDSYKSDGHQVSDCTWFATGPGGSDQYWLYVW